MKLNNVYIILVLVLVFISCNSNNDDGRKMPKSSFIIGYEVHEDQILYQYYEKFGFTDICVHTRSYFTAKDFSVTNEWMPLPMTKKDRLRINSIPNRIDSLPDDSFLVIYNHKNFFSDISLDSKEFIRETTFEKKINLRNGFYRINKTIFEVYNDKDDVIYYEYHSCID